MQKIRTNQIEQIPYSSLSGLPSLFSGNYADLNGKPMLFSGAYSDLTGKPTLFSGAYADLTGKPTLFSGSYTDLTNKPTLGTLASLSPTGTPSATTYLRGDGTWATIATGGTYTAGTGLTLTGSQFSLTTPVAVANGGTGSATQNFVDLSTTQTIGGAKTWTGGFIVSQNSGSYGRIDLAGAGAKLVYQGGGTGDVTTYMQSGNAAFTGNAPLKISGWNGNQGSTLTMDFATAYVTASTTVLGGTATNTAGVFVHNKSSGYFGIYDTAQSLVFGISAILPSPAGTATVGGYYKGLGIGGSTGGTGQPIFGVLASNQSGNGRGSVALTIKDNNMIETYNNVLDDSNGGASFKGILNVQSNDSYFGRGYGTGAATNAGYVHLGDLGTSNAYIEAKSSATNADLFIRTQGTGLVKVMAGLMPATAAGYDIGSTSLIWNNVYGQNLQIGNTTNIFGQLTAGSNGIAYNTINSNGRHIFLNAGNEKARINESGYLGIQQNTPTQGVDLASTLSYAIDMPAMGTVTATPSTTGGTLAAGTYYFKVVATDQRGGLGLPSAEVSAVVTGTTGSVALSWPSNVSTNNAYRIYYGTTSNGQTSYMSASGTSYTFTTTTGGTAAAVPTGNSAYSVRVDGSGTTHFPYTGNPGLIVGTSNGGGFFRLGDATLKKSSGNFFSFNGDGVQGINNLTLGQDSPNTTQMLFVKASSTSNATIQVVPAASQTANLLEIRNTANTATSLSINVAGALTLANYPTASMMAANRDYADSAVTKLANGFAITHRPNIRQVVAPASGEGYLYYFTAKTNDTIIKVQVNTSGTAGAGLTLARIGIYTVDASDNLTLVASTPTGTPNAGFGSTYNSVVIGLSSSYVFVPGQRYAVMVLFVGTTPPSMVCASGSDDYGQNAMAPRLCGKVTGLTDLPNTQANTGLTATGVGINAVMLQT